MLKQALCLSVIAISQLTYAQSATRVEMMLFQPKDSPSKTTSYYYPALPTQGRMSHNLNEAIDDLDLENGDHAKFFKRILSRGNNKLLWSGTWLRDKPSFVDIIDAEDFKVLLMTDHKNPLLYTLMLIKDHHVVSRTIDTIQYRQPIYIDHPQYAIALHFSKEDLPEVEDTIETGDSEAQLD